MNSVTHYHFTEKGAKAYSPVGVKNLFEKAIIDEDGSIEAVLTNKHKYKNLIELWYASFLAFAIHKWLKRKFNLNVPEKDPPDVLFLDESSGEAFPVEIMELFEYGKNHFDEDYEKLTKRIWQTKGITDLQQCHLLLVSRINANTLNISKFLQEMKKFNWKFERIWLGVFTLSTFSWSFFEIFPFRADNEIVSISVSIKNSEDMKFFY